ncbi:MAG: hypothetical protein IKZ04_06510, partial [Spirochaetaceae bacterium]|nr:hypothetical protein [Spirochaetaceae bacterium]
WLLEKIGHLPSIGESHHTSKELFIVEDVANRRIQTIRLKIKRF